MAVYVTGLAQPITGYKWGMSADRVLVGSQFIRQWLPDAGVVAPFLPINFSRNGDGPERDANTFKVLFLGSFEPVRGVEYLLQAMSLLSDKTKRRVQLIMAWNGAGAFNYDNIQQLIDRLGIRSMVDLRGEVDTNLVYREADIVVIPRASQEKMAYPLRIPEAIHMHKPLVVSRICGMENHLEGCGLAVEPRDAEALARAGFSYDVARRVIGGKDIDGL
ncbi:MAG: glycosyltransferase family 4 protein [Proteobacteria bacterium]|nr:glycosyltransferase family 4 protein [Pseudomonadota bacterium]